MHFSRIFVNPYSGIVISYFSLTTDIIFLVLSTLYYKTIQHYCFNILAQHDLHLSLSKNPSVKERNVLFTLPKYPTTSTFMHIDSISVLQTLKSVISEHHARD